MGQWGNSDAVPLKRTCVALVGVEAGEGGALRTGTGVATRAQQTQVAACVPAGVQH